MSESAISVYVHFPWCERKCPYCDFATRPPGQAGIPHADYAEAVVAELRWRARDLTHRPLRSIFFGGGTPSLWQASSVAHVIDAVVGAFARSSEESLEITLECNPNSLTATKIADLRRAGVNRLSIGVQSLNDNELRYLGRLHTARQALHAVETACHHMPRVSSDVIFGLPDQNPDEYINALDTLVGSGVQHISAYALTIEPNTTFGALHRKGKLPLAKDSLYAKLFTLTENVLQQHAFEHYEVSNYAQIQEHSRHNCHYWEGGDYLGVGAAAVGCIASGPGTARRYTNVAEPARYLATCTSDAVEASDETLDSETLLQEALMLGLRTQQGFAVLTAKDRTGIDPESGRASKVQKQITAGNLHTSRERWWVPHARWLHLDGITASLL